MSDDKPKEWTLRELAAETGVTERTVRYYISRGLVHPPLRAGRGAAYGGKHKAQIEAVRELQAKGLMLSQIEHSLAAGRAGTMAEEIELDLKRSEVPPAGRMLWFEKDGTLAGDEAGPTTRDAQMLSAPSQTPSPAPGRSGALAEPEIWRSYEVARDVRVMLRTGAAPWRTKALVAALGRFAAEVKHIISSKEDPNEQR